MGKIAFTSEIVSTLFEQSFIILDHCVDQVQQQELEKANSELQSIPIVAVQTAQPPPAPPPLAPPAIEPKVGTNFFDHVDPAGQLQGDQLVILIFSCKGVL